MGSWNLARYPLPGSLKIEWRDRPQRETAGMVEPVFKLAVGNCNPTIPIVQNISRRRTRAGGYFVWPPEIG